MRIAIVSDIHANRPAWQAVYKDILSRQVDVTVCLGDIVGYGPHPAEVLSDVYASIHDMVIGNHEAVIAGLFDESLFNDEALAMIHSTRTLLGQKAQRLFKAMPYVIEEDADGLSIVYTHGALPDPEEFEYVESVEEASRVWKTTAADLVFIGHTHVPRYDLLDASGAYESGMPEGPLQLEEGARYIINVGSVGMPRIDDQRACYGLLDTSTRIFEHQYVPYDTRQVASDLRRSPGAGAALTQNLLKILEHDTGASVRERVDFGRTQRLEDFVTEQGKSRSTPRATGPRKQAVQIRRSAPRAGKATTAGSSVAPCGQPVASTQRPAKSRAPLFATIGIISVVVLIVVIVGIARSCKDGRGVPAVGTVPVNSSGPVEPAAAPRTLPPIGPDGTRVMVDDTFSGDAISAVNWDVRSGKAGVVDGRLRLDSAGVTKTVLWAKHPLPADQGFAVAIDVVGGHAGADKQRSAASLFLHTGEQVLRVSVQINSDGAGSGVTAAYRPRANAEPFKGSLKLDGSVKRLGFLYSLEDRTVVALAAGADGKMKVVAPFVVPTRQSFSARVMLESKSAHVLLDNFRIKEKVK